MAAAWGGRAGGKWGVWVQMGGPESGLPAAVMPPAGPTPARASWPNTRACGPDLFALPSFPGPQDEANSMLATCAAVGHGGGSARRPPRHPPRLCLPGPLLPPCWGQQAVLMPLAATGGLPLGQQRAPDEASCVHRGGLRRPALRRTHAHAPPMPMQPPDPTCPPILNNHLLGLGAGPGLGHPCVLRLLGA
jgi:hypothetical protein